LVERINQTSPDILFVAWGQPKQEKWVAKNLTRLNAKVFIGIGGTFDFVAGEIKRAPSFFQNFGLEWLWRFFKEPRRIGRIFTAVPKFIFTVVGYKTKEKV
jgi:N-acetylglucosaminyldiphosphoundecaprenol N-acetyl-beta-D-mannosaminyltransferase